MMKLTKELRQYILTADEFRYEEVHLKKMNLKIHLDHLFQKILKCLYQILRMNKAYCLIWKIL